MRLRRSPSFFWAAALAVAVLTGSTVARLAGEASARAARLGGLRDVPVAARPVAAGATLTTADVAVRALPAALLPDGEPAGAATGRTAMVDLVAGEVLLEARLAPGGVTGVAALLPEGMQALAVPVDAGTAPALHPGDRVDVLATFDVEDPSAAPTFPVATRGRVLAVTPDAVTVAVTPDEAPRVAFAIARGTVALALVAVANW